jgi:ribosomal protein S18 acetylase RimI-like enzyme
VGDVPVQPLPPQRAAAAGDCLARAFTDDPVWAGVFPDPVERPYRLAALFRALVRMHLHGQRPLTTPDLAGVALWRPPGSRARLRDTVRSTFAMPRAVASFPRDERRRLLATLRQFEGRRAALVPEPHWYLESIGVEPARQGEGIGTALVRCVLDEADTRGTPAYLETETPANVRFYEGLGFEVVEQHVAQAVGVPVWLMVRPPRP